MSGDVPNAVLPSSEVLASRNVTVPVGDPPLPFTVAVRVKPLVSPEGLTDDASITVLDCPVTTWITGKEVVGPNTPSPPYCPVMVCLPMLKADVVNVAIPAVSGTVARGA